MAGRKLKLMRILILLTAVVTLLSAGLKAGASAAPYQTYVFSYDGEVQITPDAYLPKYQISDFNKAGTLNKPSDIFAVPERGHILIADSGNNRIVVFDTDFNFLREIKVFTNGDGVEDTFNDPQGIFVSKSGMLYVADTKNERLVIFDKDYNYSRTLNGPDKKLLPSDYTYNPTAVAVNSSDEIYVISQNTNMGIMVLDSNGKYDRFIGAQRVVPSFVELMWRTFMTEEQIERSIDFVPAEYSGLDIDDEDFLYLSSSYTDTYQLHSAIWSRTNDSSYLPVKKINMVGTDVMRRNGFFPPVGDINFNAYGSSSSLKDIVTRSNEKPTPSRITDITVMDNGMYLLLDAKDNKLFAYDNSGNLLYAFGGEGKSLGLYTQLEAVDYYEDNIYALDSSEGKVTVLEKTEYGHLISKVVSYQNNREYEKAAEIWEEVLSYNNNFDLAYLGIGKAYMESGEYKKAMSYFKLINNKEYYASTYEMYREDFLSENGVWVMLIIIATVALIAFVLAKISKHNTKALSENPSEKLSDQLLFAFYLILHPIKGFRLLKEERRGNVLSASILLMLTCLSQIFADFFKCYLSADSSKPNLLVSLSSSVLPLILLCISNACFTSLMDGKGKFSDIYTAVCYASFPVTLLTVPCTLISHILTSSELEMVSMVIAFGSYWMIFLIFFGMMVVHECTLAKNIVVSVLTILGMVFILFLVFVFISLAGQILSLGNSIFGELNLRF